jgi:hypothetical protein
MHRAILWSLAGSLWGHAGCTGSAILQEVPVISPPTTQGWTGTQGQTSSLTTDFKDLLTRLEASVHEDIASLIVVSWTQFSSADVYVEYRFDEEDWEATPDEMRGKGDHEQLLLGIPYETDVTWRLSVDTGMGWEKGLEHTLRTGDLPEGLPSVEVLTSQPDLWEPSGRYLMTSVNEYEGGWTQGTYWKVIIDREGRVVWALATPDFKWTIYMRLALDGEHLMWDSATWWAFFDGGEGSEVHRAKIDGSIVETFATPGLHHAFVDLPDGSVVWGRDKGRDEVLEKVHRDGSTEEIWSCEDFHDSIDEPTASCWSNGLYWHAATDTFLFSSPNTDTMVEVDHATGETLRHFGVLNESYAFDPPDSRFVFQHGINYTDDGRLLLSCKEIGEYETLTREYEVDDETRTLHQVWSFGQGEGIYGATAGEAHRLANGNTLHNYGAHGSIREVTDAGEIVWEVIWPSDNDRLIGRSIFLDDLYPLAP